MKGTVTNGGPPAMHGTGVPGLDDVLAGGLTAGCLYLVEGQPGSDKTTLALQFLMEGAARGESVLYITLSRAVPSRRAWWWRMTPSSFAPRAAMARWDAKLKLSVRRPTTRQPSASNAWPSSSSLQAVLTWVRCEALAYQV